MVTEGIAGGPGAAAKPTVVLACSTADAAGLAKVLKRLVEAGVRVDVCAGIEVDARALQRALARGDARTSYVLCRGRDLDGVQLEHLYRLVRQSGVPTERAPVLRFEPHRADELASTVLQRLGEHGLVTTAGAPMLLSTDDVTEPVMVLPRELLPPPRAAEISDVAMPIARDVDPPAPARSAVEMRISAVVRAVAEPSPRARTRVLPVAIAAALAVLVLAVLGLRSATSREPAALVVAGLAPAPATTVAVLGRVDAMPRHVSEALERGTIRALQGLLVAFPSEVSMHRVVARRRCEELYEAGLSDWRMPTRAELDTLGEAGFFDADTTWWHAGDERERPRARWTGAAMNTVAVAPKAAARVVCVHAPAR